MFPEYWPLLPLYLKLYTVHWFLGNIVSKLLSLKVIKLILNNELHIGKEKEKNEIKLTSLAINQSRIIFQQMIMLSGK